MRETYALLESVWERLVRAVEEGSKRPSKSLKGSKLRRTSNLTFSKTGLKLHTKKQWLRLSLRTIEYATNTYKKYFYTFTINKIIFTNGERKKERPNFYRMFSQNLQISTAFIVILKMELPQCNAIGVRIPPGINPLPLWITRKTAFILINQNWVIFSCILLSRLPSFRHRKEPGFWLEVQSCPLSPVLHQQLMMG